MFNDRDLAVLGVGSGLAVLSLLLPIPFPGRLGAGFLVLVLGMSFAFVRLGSDRLPPEIWLKRRLLFLIRPRRWSFYVENRVISRRRLDVRKLEKSSSPVSAPDSAQIFNWPDGSQIAEKAARILLSALGVCFLYALSTGEAAEIGALLGRVLP